MRIARVVVARLALRALGLIPQLFASIAVARKLDVNEYALYQTISTRVSTYSMFVPQVLGYWAYRYTVQGIRGSLKMYLLVLLLAACGGFLLAFTMARLMGADIPTSLLLAVMLYFVVIVRGLSRVLGGVRPILADAAEVCGKLLYVSLIALSVFVMDGLDVQKVALYQIAGITLTIVILTLETLVAYLREPLCTRCIREWVRGAWLPFLRHASMLLIAMDVLVVLNVIRDSHYTIAAFMVVSLAARTISWLAITSVAPLHAFVLETSDVISANNVSRIILVLFALFLGYIAARPEQVVAIFNPVYVHVAAAAQLVAAATLVTIMLNIVDGIIQGMDKSTAVKPGMILKASSLTRIVSSLAYLVLLYASLCVVNDQVEAVWAWAASLLAARVLNMMLIAYVARRYGVSLSLASLAYPIAYFVIAWLVASIVAPVGYSPLALQDAMLVLTGVVYTAPVYIVLVMLVDPGLRSLARLTVEKYVRVR
ncbi:hypothetical protein Pyrfu_0576 [Pyrolobus fumarii 1A]|uniref:Polysaccharide biosynthesis protein n=1 Tax=Pyrolobus fumarii (strain DSM 11204 / 1A) TaxID=694429 RepID=G0EGZ6_PYRF1|nr:hypothetical protein [Pyrolobus fumarii]AEM38446.1 hypothetical protein Pyrfu_0576 [Pyrolobus fumarii 1A]